jgi:Zn-dependent peptidase ImmA (M78 family)
MSGVAISEGVLRWAVDRAGLRIDDLRGKFPKIQQWLTGESQPTLKQLEKLAKATLTPLGFLFLATPPEERLSIPLFRTDGKKAQCRPSPELLETVRFMEGRQAWMHEYLVEQGEKPLPFIRSRRINEEPQYVADHIRTTLRLALGWGAQSRTWIDALGVLREAIDDAGILVAANGVVGNNTQRKLDVGEFRGFVLVDEYAPIVFVNNSDSKAAQMFTLAHELAHVFFGSSAAFDLREMQPANNPTEQACNRVAAEFLVPERELREVWPFVRNDREPFQRLARRFKVSALVAARRALDLSLIDRNAFLGFYQNYLIDERRTMVKHAEGGGNFYASQNLRIGRRFGFTVLRAVKEGRLLYSEAFHLTGLYGKSFDRYAEHLKAGRRR